MTHSKQALDEALTHKTQFTNAPLRVWAVSDGRSGMENQVLGLAEAISRLVPTKISVKRITVDQRAEKLPAWGWGDPFKRVTGVYDETGHPLNHDLPPEKNDAGQDKLWGETAPDIWLACGRRTIPLTKALKTKRPQICTVQTQDPKTDIANFDLIIPPHHDALTGENVLPIIGAPNRFSAAKAQEEAALLEKALGHLPKPRLAVLIGGNSKAFTMDEASFGTIITQLEEATKHYGLMITFSRRTPQAFQELITTHLAHPDVWIWNGAPIAGLENPYRAILGLADHIAVTEESTNMITDAASTGKPVHLLNLTGGSPKFDRFHQSVAHIAHPFSLPLKTWEYEPLRETDRAARAILAHYLATL